MATGPSVTVSNQPPAPRTGRPRRRFTVDEYDRMIDSGITGEGEPVELIGGEVVRLRAMNGRHASCLSRAEDLLRERLGRSALARGQCPVRLPPADQPEPGIAVLRYQAGYYDSAHPGPAEILLIIAISESSLAFDRRVKLPVYARAGIEEVWIADVNGRLIEVYRRPERGRYRDRTLRRGEETLTPLALPNLAIGVAEIMGA